ncbi:hypothetical protein [Flavivirga algicola]|uniref:Lipoprotein n=1 Tax=Flavivirga algicola TaxID=2729136 RepID=A0ABX1S3F4_9FLAO|nr:hypothetical protein [Flavivirga algicola]NMH89608.1 hypothetical protein [Flavivirga algicola]
MKTKLIILILSLSLTNCNFSQKKINNKNSVQKEISKIRGSDRMGFDNEKNKKIYDLLNYPKEGFKESQNGLEFEILLQKDKSGFHNKGITWFVLVNNFKETEADWNELYKWSNKFDFDMTALNEFFFLSENINIEKSLERTKIIRGFFDDTNAKNKIIALREINEDKDNFSKFPFK